MKAWQFTTTGGGIENNLDLNDAAVPPPSALGPEQILVEVISMSLNPADYKIAELPLAGKMMISTPASPGMDYCGRVISCGSAIDGLKPGQLVFGKLALPTKFGTLGQYIISSRSGTAPLPECIDPDHAATIGCAGQTAYQSLVGNVSQDDKVFINGGSGGTGTYAIQIAKAMGCHVTTSCSTPNVALCRDLGADEVIDYKASNVTEQLKRQGQVFSLVIDNIGSPPDLYKASDDFLLPTGKFVQVGTDASMAGIGTLLSKMIWPSLLGGGKRSFSLLTEKDKYDELVQLGKWMKEGKIKAVLDSIFEFEDAPKAIAKLRTGRARGKIVIHVTPKP